ncbi:MAG: hypothetical protein A2Y40_09865 [Candidatus Margulisbacteria bacterium GWF2_35_9]|nr:MAG: hypothetical protein A2Y40_09865 [Candidatus Margulisbacteria bacterium GWF2_35_9]
MTQGYDLLLLVADRRELYHLLKESKQESDRFYKLERGNKKVAIFITGVGKNAIKRSQKKIIAIANDATRIINVGNTGSLKNHKFGDIIQVGQVIGSNGKEIITLNKTTDNVLVTVNSIQDKRKLIKQYPTADIVDMELFYISKQVDIDKLYSYKIVLDTFNTNPKIILTKLILPFLIRINSKKLSNFIKTAYLY